MKIQNILHSFIHIKEKKAEKPTAAAKVVCRNAQCHVKLDFYLKMSSHAEKS